MVMAANPALVQPGAILDDSTRQQIRRKKVRGWISNRLKRLVEAPDTSGNVKVAACALIADLYGLRGNQAPAVRPGTTNVMVTAGAPAVDALVDKLAATLRPPAIEDQRDGRSGWTTPHSSQQSRR